MLTVFASSRHLFFAGKSVRREVIKLLTVLTSYRLRAAKTHLQKYNISSPPSCVNSYDLRQFFCIFGYPNFRPNMKKLSETWFAEGYIDFELKKYTLLAYLQEVNKYFGQNKLYPQLADVVFHYHNLVAFRENKKFLQEHFPKKMTGIQMEKLQLLYEQMIGDDELMQELEDIIQYAADTLKTTVQTGADIYEFVEEKLSITPVGLIPLDQKEGYFFLSSGNTRLSRTYHYRLSIFEKKDEK